MRAGIGACAIDLPGHGERYQRELQDPFRTLEVIVQMIDEIDSIVDGLRALGVFNMQRLAIGGMSAGGMATMARLCQPHEFLCASVEATTGSWEHQCRRAMFQERTPEEIGSRNPIEHLQQWRDIPFPGLSRRT